MILSALKFFLVVEVSDKLKLLLRGKSINIEYGLFILTTIFLSIQN